ncbi:MAG: peptidoglycan editing factor PgeF [Candidatus Dormibacter sp.]|uniref:peptidoglycan editing factor PgeF n=1 Tax=Candidatus Dormibacter sp. TaxID=2973982 RepID=UPI000DB1E4FE|nr:MAG: peptidoglycan editing factor PgeF [Candidatus Dormibacteraeota bacterium]
MRRLSTELASGQVPAVLQLPPLAAIAGLKHGFSTLTLGSMARIVGGADSRTPARRALAEELTLPPENVVTAGAVHGSRVARVDEPQDLVPQTDGLVTDRVGLGLLVTAADCYPVLLFDPVRRAVGLAHAGWRGTAAGIAAKVVGTLALHFGSRPADLLAGLGPGICGRCYQVPPEVAAHFERRFVRPAATPSRFQLDLRAANRRHLERAGVLPNQVFEHPACTYESSFLASHRRRPDGSRCACLVALA